MKKIFSNLFTPFRKISPTTSYILIAIQAIIVIVCLQLFSNELMPKPSEIIMALWTMLQTRDFYDDLFVSLWQTLKAMSIAIAIALPISYLVTIPFFKGVAIFITKLRFLTIAGLSFVFLVILKDASLYKLSLLLFGIVPFFITSLVAEYNTIKSEELDLCKTLKMNPWQSLYELIIFGKLNTSILVIGINFAICWSMIVYVESQTMGLGGLGTIIFKSQKHLRLEEVFAVLTVIFCIGNSSDWSMAGFRKWAFPFTSIQNIN